MASEDLLKKAVAAFNALSPEQQAQMLEEQRQSWVRGNIGLSRDERGMTSPVMPRPAPAATDTGLVTVGYGNRGLIGLLAEGVATHASLCWTQSNEFSEPVCLRPQAEELLAAERVKYEAIVDSLRIQLDRVNALESDNAAKDARIKELEADRDHQSKLSNKLNRSHAALEAKLAAAEKTLAEIDASDDLSTHSLRRIARSYLEAKS